MGSVFSHSGEAQDLVEKEYPDIAWIAIRRRIAGEPTLGSCRRMVSLLFWSGACIAPHASVEIFTGLLMSNGRLDPVRWEFGFGYKDKISSASVCIY